MSSGGTRILGGQARGRVLKVPAGTRPSSARLREALFSIWAPRVVSARFLDLFAGAGAVGLEAASRGAAEVWLIEARREAVAVLRRNAELVDAEVVVRQLELPRGLERLSTAPFDLVYADPPYRYEPLPELLEAAGRFVAADGELALEHAARRDPPQAAGELVLVRTRRYGEGAVSFYAAGD